MGLENDKIVILNFAFETAQQWQLDLIARLKALSPHVQVIGQWHEGYAPLALPIRAYLQLEKALHGFKPCVFDKISPAREMAFKADFTFDFCEMQTPNMQVLFDNCSNFEALFFSLLHCSLPHIDVVMDGKTLSSARPMIDQRQSLTLAAPYIFARVATLLASIIAGKPCETLPPKPLAQRDISLKDVIKYAFTQAKARLIRIPYRLFFYSPHWRVGYRFNKGASPYQTGSLEGTAWQPLKNPPHRFLADPFPFHYQGKNYLFVEDYDHRAGVGKISALEINAQGVASEPVIIIDEAFHLSYPHVFLHQGEVYLLPESGSNKTLSLYRAVEFPYKWVKETTLFEGIELADATPFIHNGKWWLIATMRDGAGSAADTLVLYSALALKGPWLPHKNNPIRIDCASTRPAGKVIFENNRLIRPVQDCSSSYGGAMQLYEITRLDDEVFQEHYLAPLTPHAKWRGWRMHTLNKSGEFEVIDGSDLALKLLQ